MSTGGGGTEELPEALLTLCKSPTLSLESLREIIGRYSLKTNGTSEDIKNTFFIEACGNEVVDERIIQCLLDYFPDAIDGVEEQGWTPLHAACSNKNVALSVIDRLILLQVKMRITLVNRLNRLFFDAQPMTVAHLSIYYAIISM